MINLMGLLGLLIGLLFFSASAIFLSGSDGKQYGPNWDYVITSCGSKNDWIGLSQHYDPLLTDETRVIKTIVFIEDGAAFTFKEGFSKYANDTTYINRIEVGLDTIQIWIDESVSRDSDGYLFTKVQPQCRREFLAYVRARPFLEKHLVVLTE